ncbi:hypothetical protein D3C81_724070 [compost metagenome]
MVDFLVIKKVARIEQAHLIEHLATHQVEAARQPVAFTHRGMVPGHLVDHLQPGEKAPQPGTRDKHIQGRGEVATTGLQVTVAPHQAHAQNAAVRVRVHVIDGFLQAVGGDEGVGVEQQRVLALQMRQQLIVGAAETDIMRVAQQHSFRADLSQTLHRIVDGCVVHYQIAGQPFTPGLAQRIEHRLQQRCGIEIDDHHVDGFAIHCCRLRRNTRCVGGPVQVPQSGRRRLCVV